MAASILYHAVFVVEGLVEISSKTSFLARAFAERTPAAWLKLVGRVHLSRPDVAPLAASLPGLLHVQLDKYSGECCQIEQQNSTPNYYAKVCGFETAANAPQDA